MYVKLFKHQRFILRVDFDALTVYSNVTHNLSRVLAPIFYTER